MADFAAINAFEAAVKGTVGRVDLPPSEMGEICSVLLSALPKLSSFLPDDAFAAALGSPSLVFVVGHCLKRFPSLTLHRQLCENDCALGKEIIGHLRTIYTKLLHDVDQAHIAVFCGCIPAPLYAILETMEWTGIMEYQPAEILKLSVLRARNVSCDCQVCDCYSCEDAREFATRSANRTLVRTLALRGGLVDLLVDTTRTAHRDAREIYVNQASGVIAHPEVSVECLLKVMQQLCEDPVLASIAAPRLVEPMLDYAMDFLRYDKSGKQVTKGVIVDSGWTVLGMCATLPSRLQPNVEKVLSARPPVRDAVYLCTLLVQLGKIQPLDDCLYDLPMPQAGLLFLQTAIAITDRPALCVEYSAKVMSRLVFEMDSCVYERAVILAAAPYWVLNKDGVMVYIPDAGAATAPYARGLFMCGIPTDVRSTAYGAWQDVDEKSLAAATATTAVVATTPASAAAALEKERKTVHSCKVCGKQPAKRCSSCVVGAATAVYYCGRDCQKADWPQHKAVHPKKAT